jgi:hypothetical protein
MTTFTTLNDTLEDWIGDIDPNAAKPSYPFGVRVGCVKMSSPRHERFNFIRDMGADLLDNLFNNTPINATHPVFIFPERHLSVHEQSSIMLRLSQHVSADNFECIDIITSSPLVIGNFNRETIRILTWSDDEKYNGQFN